MLPELFAATLPAIRPDLDIWTTAPAQHFTESTPLGNGRLGAMIFGGVDKERVVLNESTVWSGSPQDADREDAFKVLPEIRRLLLAGENRKAQDLLQQNFVCKGPGSGQGASKDGPYGCYQVLANLEIEGSRGAFENYRRTLTLDDATSVTTYRQGGVDYKREGFVSAPDKAFVYRFSSAQKGKISFTARLTRPENSTTSALGQDYVIAGQLKSGSDKYPGVRSEGRLRAVAEGGSVQTTSSGIVIRNADRVTLYFTAGTDMFDKNFRPKVARDLEAVSKRPFGDLVTRHKKDYRSFFDRCRLNLPVGHSSGLPTNDRLGKVHSGEDDPSLAELYFNFGRYLLISSSRPDSPLPSNLQGIWAEELLTPWNGDFHIDINVQMNYWPVEVTNLADCHRPLLDFVGRLVPNGQKTAKAYYGANGWVAHVITNPWLYTSPGEHASWGSTCSGAGWLCQHLWEHYAFTKDRAYLAKAYPVLKGSAEFFLDMLIEEPEHKWLVTAPSNSPENTYIHPKDGALNTCMGPTMDNQIVHELFTNVIQASKELGIDETFRNRVEAARKRLAPMQIGKHGQLQEWLQDYDEAEPNHRHVSHLYGLYPSNQISPSETPMLASAARKSLERRGDSGTGWSLAWKVCFWSRLEDGDRAWKLLKNLFRPVNTSGVNMSNGGGTFPNLFDAHPPFQIDGNFGATAGIAEMLMQSDGNTIRLLPALPKAWARAGSVKGMRARGGATVDFAWRDGRVTSFKVKNGSTMKVVKP